MTKLLCCVQIVALLLVLPARASADAPFSTYTKCGPGNVVYGRAASAATGVRTIGLGLRAPDGTVAPGEMVEPARAGKHPAILFVHWLGDAKTTNHTEFHSDAIALAARGITSLSVDAMWAKPHWFREMGADASSDYARTVAQVIALRCALDVLSARPGVDASRIAFVGHDFGAMFGALLAGVDTRPKWYVLMAGNDTLAGWYLFGKKIADRTAYEQALAPVDIVASLQRSKARAFLFQFAQADSYIPVDNALRFAMASGLPRAIYFYAAPHSLAVPQATADRTAWLLSHLSP